MKNIHVLPTDQPSRLWVNNLLQGKLELSEETLIGSLRNRYIYITSDEEIKKGDWVIQVNFEKTNIQLTQCITEFQTKIANDKDGSFTKNKIILTTDPTLIADGVQSIDEEFLEWFVKNPSCEFIDVFKDDRLNHYNIFIPQEETKQKVPTYDESIQHILTAHKIPKELFGQEEPKTGYSKSETEFLGVEFTLKDGSKQFVPKQEILPEFTLSKGIFDKISDLPKQETKTITYWKDNCEEDYLHTPISVLRYISELEKLLGL